MFRNKGSAAESRQTQLERLKSVLREADAVVLGAGAGMSTAAGFVYSGERFRRYFSDLAARYGFQDMYSGGFFPYPGQEEFWAFWSRNIYVNRYMDPPGAIYRDVMTLLRDRDYFVLTTNVDHCFQKAEADKDRLFYTQGDYGLFQCSEPCHQETYDNEAAVRAMVKAQGFTIEEDGALTPPEEGSPAHRIPSALLPRCPRCGRPMTMNLRSDDRFVEDEGWHLAAGRYREFLRNHSTGKVVYLEIGVGFNTPGIIKYPFWQRVLQNPEATYVCLNYEDAAAPKEIRDRSICIGGDSAGVIAALLE